MIEEELVKKKISRVSQPVVGVSRNEATRTFVRYWKKSFFRSQYKCSQALVFHGRQLPYISNKDAVTSSS
jgi:hypothetical protein